MAYEFRSLRRYKARYNSSNADNLLTISLVIDGAKQTLVTGDTATITIYHPSDLSTALVTDGAMTVTNASSLATYALDTTTVASFPSDTGYRGDVTITINATSIAYTGHVVFDIAPYVLELAITADQLLDRDDRLRGMTWAGDSDLSGIIEACRDELQLKLEGESTVSTQVLETMALDHSKLAVVQRLYILEAIFRAKGDEEAADFYERRFTSSWKNFLSQMKFDTGQTGAEDETPTKTVIQRLHT